MKTKAQLIAQCKLENPTMVQTINDVEITLSATEYDAACETWAEMQLVQQSAAAAQESTAAAKSALLERLGMTADEAALLLQ